MKPEKPPLEIDVIQTPKKSGVLAAMLREKILSDELQEGDPLPSERELVERTGISRTSVREALSLLEADDLITTRPGRNGGAVVQKPGPAIMTRPIQLLIRGRRLPFQAVIETREALEPSGASLAAIHRTNDDLERMERACLELESSLEDVSRYLKANTKWHLAVMQASHNDLLIGFMLAISDVMHAATNIDEFNTPESRLAVAKAHRRVMDAILRQDAAAARRRMERHVVAYSKQIAPHAPANISLED
ncbi:FadR/GntR family transcriptional regulator [Bradyrhizobium sp. NC92]|uniref:FadR/GntR family transcriptional regulator n=1 Tax=Bradyrhizobium sp. (strain NC92) TaxID=55395 RepID=UPI0021AAF656|nr:FadR/GntR family transcriptional regulator [Bradyrhizobium sp. NC92]UWU67968.1 FadR family transcriptional regulator [Bradyrhizobium sp. NC92]